MKLIVILAGFIFLCQGTKEPTCMLENDLVELVNLFPGNESTTILNDYLKHDPACRVSHDYIASEEFEEVFSRVRKSSQYTAVMNYLNDIGYPGLLNLGEHFEPAPRPPKQPRSGTGYHSFISDVINILPRDDTRNLFQQKIKSNDCFKNFVDKIQGLEFQALLTALEKSTEYEEMKEKLHEHGVDLHDIYHLYEQILGFDIFSMVEESWDSYKVKTEL